MALVLNRIRDHERTSLAQIVYSLRVMEQVLPDLVLDVIDLELIAQDVLLGRVAIIYDRLPLRIILQWDLLDTIVLEDSLGFHTECVFSDDRRDTFEDDRL